MRSHISWDPLSSDSDVKAIVEKMKTLDTGKVVDEGAKMVADEGNKESKDKTAEEVGKDKDVGDGTMEVEKVKEEEEPEFGVEEDNEVEFQLWWFLLEMQFNCLYDAQIQGIYPLGFVKIGAWRPCSDQCTCGRTFLCPHYPLASHSSSVLCS